MEKEGSKREHGSTFCFDFWMRFGDHRALYHIPIVIIPTLLLILVAQGASKLPAVKVEDKEK